MCARTLFANAEVVLWRTAQNTYRLEAWRSFAPYAADLLNRAAQHLTQSAVRDGVSLDGTRIQAAK
jgi:sarcosine oxidase gamma subunit